MIRVLALLVWLVAMPVAGATEPAPPPGPAQVAPPAASPPAASPSEETPREPGSAIARGQRRGKGSGFWTSDVPADDHPYRWGHMAIGAGVFALMLGLVLLLIRKHSRRPAQRG